MDRTLFLFNHFCFLNLVRMKLSILMPVCKKSHAYPNLLGEGHFLKVEK